MSTKPDDRHVCDGGIYCTTNTGKNCRYEVDGYKGKRGITGLACNLFRTKAGQPKALRIGRDLQSRRCPECRAHPAGFPIPDHTVDWPRRDSPKVGKTETQLEQILAEDGASQQEEMDDLDRRASADAGNESHNSVEEVNRAMSNRERDDAYAKAAVADGCPPTIADAVSTYIAGSGPYEGAAMNMPADIHEVGLAGLSKHEGWFSYGLGGVYREYRQVCHRAIAPHAVSADIVWYYDGTGVAFVRDGHAPARIFLIGCIHEWTHHSNDGRCLNTYRCKKCGRLNQVDSSD